jgi:hypothetical protein
MTRLDMTWGQFDDKIFSIFQILLSNNVNDLDDNFAIIFVVQANYQLCDNLSTDISPTAGLTMVARWYILIPEDQFLEYF